MIKIIVIVVAIVLIFVIIAYSDYISWFFKLLKGEIQHNNNLNKLMNKNKKNSLVSKKDIKKYLEMIDFNIRKLGYPLKSEYKLLEELERKLMYSRFDNKYIQELFKSIYEYMGINGEELKFTIRRTSSRTQTPVAGSYNEINKEVTLEVSTYTTIDQVISTLSHELSHHILLSNKVELKNRLDNEILTDLTAIYMGFHKYFYKAYRDKSRIVYEGERRYGQIFRNRRLPRGG